eukprot:TRINITY_DN61195_c0_g1_i1.p1 TRINITY_DN61195_c0_g1~~TRINITY_DN61195_c0_g1_i1.p1  ORF type:complete len:297 (+),score=31.65 TRINITY_DN61195_c0_g1_i1:213-1103(+)
MGSSHSIDDVPVDGLGGPSRQLPPESSVVVPGHSNVGGACTCNMPPLTIRKLKEMDAEYLRTLDPFAMNALTSKKAEADARFGVGFGRAEAAAKRIDKSLDFLNSRYSVLAQERLALEHAQQDAAFVHLRHCDPLKSKFGLQEQCQDEFDVAMKAYRSQLRQPECAVGATLPLAPASVLPFEVHANDARIYMATALEGCRTSLVGRRSLSARVAPSQSRKRLCASSGRVAARSTALEAAAAVAAAFEAVVAANVTVCGHASLWHPTPSCLRPCQREVGIGIPDELDGAAARGGRFL